MDSITTPNVDLQLYGDGKNIVAAVGKGDYWPRLFFGLCDRPCGFTLRDKNNYFDLRGKANIKFTTIVSGFHRVRPLIKLADGALLIGDQAEGSVADLHSYEVSFSEVRWVKLDPDRGVTLIETLDPTLGGTWIENPDLSKVDEVGYFDILPGSGVRVEGTPLEKMPPPPAGDGLQFRPSSCGASLFRAKPAFPENSEFFRIKEREAVCPKLLQS